MKSVLPCQLTHSQNCPVEFEDMLHILASPESLEAVPFEVCRKLQALPSAKATLQLLYESAVFKRVHKAVHAGPA